MKLQYYIDNRTALIEKVCCRNYECADTNEMIVVNIKNKTTSFLEGVSAQFFDVLYKRSISEIEQFIRTNDIDKNEVENFLEELLQEGIIGESIKNVLRSNFQLDREEQDGLKEFEETLYKNHYLFNVHIDITDMCNLKCVHCYQLVDAKVKHNISTNRLKRFIDDVYDLGVFSVTLSGGEIFLRNEIWELVKYISEKGMVITLFTNAALLGEEDIKKINQFNVHKVAVSLYSVKEDIHDSITGVIGSCEKTKAALEKLKATDVQVEVKCVLMKPNFPQYQSMDFYCKERGFSLILDTSMTPKLNGDRKPLEYTFEFEQIIQFALDENYNYYVGKNRTLDFEKEPCSAGKISLYCSPEGKIYPCVSLRLELGDMEKIKNIWSDSMDLRQWQRTRMKDFNYCGKQNYCKFCVEVCAGICFLENGDYLYSNTSQCFKAKAREEAYKRLEKSFVNI